MIFIAKIIISYPIFIAVIINSSSIVDHSIDYEACFSAAKLKK